jgi:phage terminase large subunit-like protein
MNAPTNIAGYDPTRNPADCTFDPDAARLVIEFFEEVLTHPDESPTAKAGDKFLLEQWQKDFIATIFGWKRPDQSRRYAEVFAAVPRKNGKTALAAGLALYGLWAERRLGAQIYSAAMDRDQASAIYRTASRMVLQDQTLTEDLNCIDSTKRIVNRSDGSFYAALSGDAQTGHSKKPYYVLFDELHTQRTRALYDNLQTGMGSTVNRLFLSITTAGWNRSSICYDVWKRARRVRDNHGKDDPYFLPMLYELKDGQDWNDEKTWAACNPNLGVSISREFLREEYAKAKQSPAYENTFRNLYLNDWTEQAIRWLSMRDWDACDSPLPDVSGEPCWGALDMSATTDITAFVLAFPLSNGRMALLPHFWIPADTARRKETIDGVPYREWEHRGYMTLIPGQRIDSLCVRDDILKIIEPYSVQEIAVDRALAREVIRLLQEGFDSERVVEFPQTIMHLTGPSKQFERMILGRELVHGGNPILRWMASNVAIEKDKNENIRPVKDRSAGRIDGIVAAVMAVGRAATAQPQADWWNPSDGVLL